ncbi:MAG: RNA polymerase sigma factor [Oscillospiraceae bacterium]|nr:RNA polymerase sigma factor [Oscillospiraceae bacterium]
MDARQVERLVGTYSDMILRLSYAYLRSTQDAEDICQNVLLRLMTTDQTFTDPTHEKAWIIRVTINACKDELRAARRRKTVSLEEARNVAIFAEEVSPVLTAVFSLPLKYRQVIHLYYYEGYSQREIAQLLGENENTVASRLHRGREKLKKILGGQNND